MRKLRFRNICQVFHTGISGSADEAVLCVPSEAANSPSIGCQLHRKSSLGDRSNSVIWMIYFLSGV